MEAHLLRSISLTQKRPVGTLSGLLEEIVECTVKDGQSGDDFANNAERVSFLFC